MPKPINFRVDFWSRKKWAPREDFDGFWSRFERADLENLLYIEAKSMIFHFWACRLPRELLASKSSQNDLKMRSKTCPKWDQKWGLKSRWFWDEVSTRLSRIWDGLLATSGVPIMREKEGLKAQTYPNTPLPLSRGGGSKALRAYRRPMCMSI